MTTTNTQTHQIYPMISIELTAHITVTDANYTAVPVDSLDDAIKLMMDRSTRTGKPLVTLAEEHRHDAFFHSAVWQLEDGVFTATDLQPLQADYALTFEKWQVWSTDGQSGPILSGHPQHICQTLAERTGHIVTMTSHLPGIEDQTYSPGSTAEDTQDDTLASAQDTSVDTAEAMTAFTDQLVETPLEASAQPTSTVKTTSQDSKTPLAEDAKDESTTALPATRREARRQRTSFLTPTTTEAPASKGFRGFLSTLGIRMSPSDKERTEREDVRAISQHWPGPRTIAVANGKGGAGKTPTTIMLSAVFARFGGGSVLAWDNNQTRGTLGWRTEQGPHESTVVELLPQADSLLAVGAQSADLAHFLHHQPSDRYEVLRSKPSSLADEQRFEASDLNKIHAVASKFYRLIIIDSGNDETDPLWRAMINKTDQLVVPTSTGDDKAEGAALLLEDLAESSAHGQKLADNAVVVVSQAEQTTKPAHRRSIAQGFEPLAREVVEVPFDPAMVSGHLAWDALKPETQRAWIAAGAAVARGL